jgi:hypothetical protein
MSYAFGENNNGREIGYGVVATCDFEGCGVSIDRGMDYCCGGIEATGNAGMEDEPYCGDYFCYGHLTFIELSDEDTLQVCTNCAETHSDDED